MEILEEDILPFLLLHLHRDEGWTASLIDNVTTKAYSILSSPGVASHDLGGINLLALIYSILINWNLLIYCLPCFTCTATWRYTMRGWETCYDLPHLNTEVNFKARSSVTLWKWENILKMDLMCRVSNYQFSSSVSALYCWFNFNMIDFNENCLFH